MSIIEANTLKPISGSSTLTLGESGDTVTLASGASSSGFGATLTGSTNNTVVTVTGANAMQGEANLTYDGTTFLLSQASPKFKVLPTTNGNSGVVEICGRATDGSPTENRTQIKGEPEGSTANTKMTFHTENSSGVNERMSISSDGVLKVNTRMFVDGEIDSIAKINAVFGGSNENGMQFSDKDGATSGKFIGFSRNGTSTSSQGTQIGYISRNGSNDSVTYSTTSDYRLKEGIVDKTDGIEKLKQLKPRKFYWKSNTEKTLVDGFIAHEVSGVVPEAIGGEKDAVDSEGNPIYQGIDQSKLVPLLTAALQEAITKIETLEAKVAALESA